MQKKIFLSAVLSMIFLLAVLSIAFLFSPVFSADKEGFQFKKQPEIQQIKPKKPVKITLKRSKDGRYAWDLRGDDVDAIVAADRRLRKLLKVE